MPVSLFCRIIYLATDSQFQRPADEEKNQMKKNLLIIANWKANVVEVPQWVRQFKIHAEKLSGDLSNVEIAIAAPFSLLFLLATSATLASQDISSFPEGAYTGETSGELLKQLDVKYCLIGHSERRKYFNENNDLVEKKMKQALKSGIVPILCAQTFDEIPENIRNYSGERFIIMYEPNSAISTDGIYHPEDPKKVEDTIEQWKSRLHLDCEFLYGGSVNPENAHLFVKIPSISGLVIGHASLNPNDFFEVIKKCLTSSEPV